MSRVRIPPPTSKRGREYDSRRLTVDDARALREACRANAAALVNESDLLRGHEHYARAFVLAYFAVEEYVKAVMLISMEAILLQGHAVEWRSFWAHWYHHDPKSEAGLLFGRGLPEGVEDVLAFLAQVLREAQVPASIAAEAAVLRINREAATYVDWPLRVQLPSAMTPQASADELIAFARRLADQVDLFGTIFDTPEVMEAWELVNSAFASGDFETLRAVLMAVAPPNQA